MEEEAQLDMFPLQQPISTVARKKDHQCRISCAHHEPALVDLSPLLYSNHMDHKSFQMVLGVISYY